MLQPLVTNANLKIMHETHKFNHYMNIALRDSKGFTALSVYTEVGKYHVYMYICLCIYVYIILNVLLIAQCFIIKIH